MGKSNHVLKEYWSAKPHFAELFNGTIFGGRQVVKPEQLEELDTAISTSIASEKEVLA